MPGVRPAVAAVLGLVLGLSGQIGVARAQQGPSAPASGAALRPDTVRVGEQFTLGLSVAGSEKADVRFPPLLNLEAEVEQLRPVEARWEDAGGGSWRARYVLAAWKAGTWPFPPVTVEVDGVTVSLTPPPVQVMSVLPAASEGPLPLEGPRGPEPVRRFPWWLLLLLLALALLWWLLRRLRKTDEEMDAPQLVDPALETREALERLKKSLEEGDLDLAAYYDGLEKVLRRYLAARRGWPPERPVREFVTAGGADPATDLEAGLLSLQARSGLVRFAHVRGARTIALGDADACLAWVEAEEAEAA